jgi:hypothetical protein
VGDHFSVRLMEQKGAFVRIPNMFPTIEVQALRRSALAAMKAQAIPRDKPLEILGGHGSGETCPVCSQSIDPADMELELAFAPLESGQTPLEVHLHLPCFEAWDLVRTSVIPEA